LKIEEERKKKRENKNKNVIDDKLEVSKPRALPRNEESTKMIQTPPKS
jgi:hypothetical protein